MITISTGSYRMLLEPFGERMKEGKASPLLFSLWCLKLSKESSLCMGALGGLYRPTPRGTKVIRLDAGLGHQCLYPPASPPAVGARRLVGPANWWVLPTAVLLVNRSAPPLGGLVGGWLLLPCP